MLSAPASRLLRDKRPLHLRISQEAALFVSAQSPAAAGMLLRQSLAKPKSPHSERPNIISLTAPTPLWSCRCSAATPRPCRRIFRRTSGVQWRWPPTWRGFLADRRSVPSHYICMPSHYICMPSWGYALDSSGPNRLGFVISPRPPMSVFPGRGSSATACEIKR